MARPIQSVRLKDDDDTLRQRFGTLRTRRDIASLLNIDDHDLIYLLYRGGRKYTEFDVPKRRGGLRHISAPESTMKIVQRRLNQVLQAVYAPKAPVHGFARDRSIVTNARRHLRKRILLNIDLEEFFPTIHFGRVRGMFAGPPYLLPAAVAQVLAQICCHNKALPQGAPTSPVVSNMVSATLDGTLRTLAEQHGCTYTRYADDITFSTTRRRLPDALATVTSNSDGTRRIEVGGELREAVERNSFRINGKKVRLRCLGERREVTGLVVGTVANVPREYVRQIRGLLHAWEKFGYDAAESELRARHHRKHRRPGAPELQLLAVAAGKLEFLRMVKGANDPVYTRLWNRFARVAGDPYKPRTALVQSRDQIPATLWVIESGDRQSTAFMLEGYGLVTCAHALQEDSVIVYQPTAPSDRRVATVTHLSTGLDLARLRIDGPVVAMAGMGDADALAADDPVVVAGFGNYGPGGTSRLANGRITGFGRLHGIRVFYTDHRVFAGTSGAPVLNAGYAVVGVLQRGVNPEDPMTYGQETVAISIAELPRIPTAP